MDSKYRARGIIGIIAIILIFLIVWFSFLYCIYISSNPRAIGLILLFLFISVYLIVSVIVIIEVMRTEVERRIG